MYQQDTDWLQDKNNKKLYDVIASIKKDNAGNEIIKHPDFYNLTLSSFKSKYNINNSDILTAKQIHARRLEQQQQQQINTQKTINDNIIINNLLNWVDGNLIIRFPDKNNPKQWWNKYPKIKFFDNRHLEDLYIEYGINKLYNAINDQNAQKYIRFPKYPQFKPKDSAPFFLGDYNPIIGEIQQKLGTKPTNNFWIKTHILLDKKFDSKLYNIDTGITQKLINIILNK